MQSSAVIDQTPWPGYMVALEPDKSDSPVAAVWPNDVVLHAPDCALSPEKARWSGRWTGWAWQGRLCDIKLAVESVTAAGAEVVYARGSAPFGLLSERLTMRFADNELCATLKNGVEFFLRMRSTEPVVELFGRIAGGEFAGVLAKEGSLTEPMVQRVPTPFVEDGMPVSLEALIYKPAGPGPFPLLVVNHGSTGNGDNPALFKSTWSSPSLARFFTEQGWLVAFPQRRGRGKSDGLYDEGFEPDRSAYTDDPERSLAGFERALSDLDMAVAWLKALPEVNPARVFLCGVSRGGILASVFAGTRQLPVTGVINFVGGWVGEGCKSAKAINTTSFQRAAASPVPQLWLYADGDPYYSLAHSRSNFDAFVVAGGKGRFEVLPVLPGEDGHHLHSRVLLWSEPMQEFLKQIAPS